jgi:hypothetical protein
MPRARCVPEENRPGEADGVLFVPTAVPIGDGGLCRGALLGTAAREARRHGPTDSAGLVTVELANKTARIVWALLAKGGPTR